MGIPARNFIYVRVRWLYNVCGNNVSDVLDENDTRLTSLPVFNAEITMAGRGISGLCWGRVVWKGRNHVDLKGGCLNGAGRAHGRCNTRCDLNRCLSDMIKQMNVDDAQVWIRDKKTKVENKWKWNT